MTNLIGNKVDKRKSVRLIKNFPVQLKTKGMEGFEASCGKNLSKGGLSFEYTFRDKAYLDMLSIAGQALDLIVSLPEKGIDIRIEGEVVWLKRQEQPFEKKEEWFDANDIEVKGIIPGNKEGTSIWAWKETE